MSESTDEDYLGLIKILSETHVSQICKKPSEAISLNHQKDQKNVVKTSDQPTQLSLETENKKAIKTITLKDCATQFDHACIVEEDNELPKEIWPSWYSENNKQVQTDSIDKHLCESNIIQPSLVQGPYSKTWLSPSSMKSCSEATIRSTCGKCDAIEKSQQGNVVVIFRFNEQEIFNL